jgi:hypothetical protein
VWRLVWDAFARPDRAEGGIEMHIWQRRTAGALVAAVGVAFIVVVVVNQLFSVGPAFERMSDGFRPIMQPAAIAQLESDVNGLSAVSTEFTTTGVPMFSQALGMSPEEFQTFMAQEYPAVATGMEQLPTIVTQFGGVVGTLKAEQDRFAQADAIPTSNLPATTVPWGLLIAGLALLALGIVMIVWPRRVASWIAVGLGALLIVVPVAFSLPQKASAADTMNRNLEPVYTAQMLTQAQGALATIGAMGQEMQTNMLPDLGSQLDMNEAELQAFLGENMPATAAALQTMPDAMGRFQALIATFDTHLPDYETLKPVSFVPIVWTMIGGGIVVLLAGAWALIAARRVESGEVEVPTLKAA